ncbi:hypothetical protein [Tomitella biformata]|nr:hypothetical protein [Tomitella biformata]
MQKEPGTAQPCHPAIEVLIAVAIVASDGVARMLQVDTDLMLAVSQS